MSEYEPRTMSDQYAAGASIAAQAPADTRRAFLRKTYLHLLGAIVAFIALTAAIQSMPGVEALVDLMWGTTWSWFVVLALYMLVSVVATRMAASATSLSTQYLGLTIYVVLMSIITTPMVYLALRVQEMLAVPPAAGPPILLYAAGGTLGIFGLMTAIVLLTKKDFSFMRSALYLLTAVALGLIVCSMAFGFDLTMVFTVGMIALMSMYILYHTSNVLHHYQTGQYVVASLSLFASVITLFWYVLDFVLRIYGSFSGD